MVDYIYMNEERMRCYDEERDFTLEELGDEAWLTGCPLCGSSSCGMRLSKEEKEEIDKILDGEI